MEEEDSAQSFSMESEQPGMKRTKESNKDGKKKKKRHSAQDAGSESGRSSPLVGVHLGADGYTVTVTPAHTGQEEFHLISAATSSPKEDHSKGKNPQKHDLFFGRSRFVSIRLNGEAKDAQTSGEVRDF